MSLKLINAASSPFVNLSDLSVTDLFREDGRIYMVTSEVIREQDEDGVPYGAPFVRAVALDGRFATTFEPDTYVEPLVGELTARRWE